MSLWLQHGSKLSNTPQKILSLIALAAPSLDHRSNLLYSTHHRFSQVNLWVRINWMRKIILTIQLNSTNVAF